MGKRDGKPTPADLRLAEYSDEELDAAVQEMIDDGDISDAADLMIQMRLSDVPERPEGQALVPAEPQRGGEFEKLAKAKRRHYVTVSAGRELAVRHEVVVEKSISKSDVERHIRTEMSIPTFVLFMMMVPLPALLAIKLDAVGLDGDACWWIWFFGTLSLNAAAYVSGLRWERRLRRVPTEEDQIRSDAERFGQFVRQAVGGASESALTAKFTLESVFAALKGEDTVVSDFAARVLQDVPKRLLMAGRKASTNGFARLDESLERECALEELEGAVSQLVDSTSKLKAAVSMRNSLPYPLNTI